MGLPALWSRVKTWLSFDEEIHPTVSQNLHSTKIKCPSIPVLNDYCKKPSVEFWKKFPSRPFPDSIVPIVNTTALEGLVNNFEHLLTDSQIIRARKVIKNLSEGAPSYQKQTLPSHFEANAKITSNYGREITDSVGHWISEGFACGPFDYPPLERFRVNSILAVPQDGKVRPVLNVSLPESASFNSNIDSNLLEKVRMSSSREFGFLMKIGRAHV